jgi:signal transduction histidine kinase
MAGWMLGLPEIGLAWCVLVYSAVVHASDRWALRSAAGSVVMITGWTATGALVDHFSDDPDVAVPFYLVAMVGLLGSIAFSLGTTVRTQAKYAAEVERRAALAERQQEADRRSLVQEERSRIARELHDIVAHGLSVIVLQAEAAQRLLRSDPQRAVAPLTDVQDTARNALNEMRQVLGVLRTDTVEGNRPLPLLTDLDELVDDMRRSGLHVDLTSDVDDSHLPDTAQTTAYRLVQESLTNVLRHAGRGARATVSLRSEPTALTITVDDDGAGTPSLLSSAGTGHGHVGMRERIAVFGGTLQTGPRPGGGYRVLATLPAKPVSRPTDRVAPEVVAT